jgi:hypothetical protein
LVLLDLLEVDVCKISYGGFADFYGFDRGSFAPEVLHVPCELGLGHAENIGLQAFPVFLAVLEKTGIIGPVLDVLPEKLYLRSLPGLRCHSQTVEVDRRSGKFF